MHLELLVQLDWMIYIFMHHHVQILVQHHHRLYPSLVVMELQYLNHQFGKK